MYGNIPEGVHPKLDAATAAVMLISLRGDPRGKGLQMSPPSQNNASRPACFVGNASRAMYRVEAKLGKFEGHPREIGLDMFGFLKHKNVGVLVRFLYGSDKVAQSRNVV
jgi:hypothetical protein